MIRVLSMWQPWASLTCTIDPDRGGFAKQFETRHWGVRVTNKQYPCTRGENGSWVFRDPIEIAIHATLRDETDNIRDPALRNVLSRCGLLYMQRPRGQIIAIARIPFVVRAEDCDDEREAIVGDLSPGRFAWKLDDVQPLEEPVPLKGRQGVLWVLPVDIERQVREQVGGLP